MKPKIIIVANRKSDVEIVTPGSSLMGIRAEQIIIVDDLKDHRQTAVQRARLKQWFDEVLRPVLTHDGIFRKFTKDR